MKERQSNREKQLLLNNVVYTKDLGLREGIAGKTYTTRCMVCLVEDSVPLFYGAEHSCLKQQSSGNGKYFRIA